MTAVLEVAPRSPATPVVGPLRRAWCSRLLWHAAVLLVLMASIGVFIGMHTAFTDDEAGMVLQTQAVAHGHWLVPDAFPRVDPEQHDFALQGISPQRNGFAPLDRHLTYIVIVAPILLVAGAPGLMGLSMLATVLAALCSARLARLYGTGHERVVFWATAVASPLFFYGFVDTGQTVGAAAVAACTVAALAFLRHGRLVTLAAAGLAMGLAVAAREEAMAWCAAACLASPLLMRATRAKGGYSLRRVGLLLASMVGGGTMVRLTDLLLFRSAEGHSQGLAQPVSSKLAANSLTNQLKGFFIAVSGVGHGADPFSQLHYGVIIITFAGLALTAVAARMLCNREPIVVVSAAAGLAAVCFLVRLILEPTVPVAGLLPACPVLWAGLWLIGRAELRSPGARWAVGTALAFAVGVAASVDSSGGGLQWGGRYLALGLPVVLPLVIAAMGRSGAALSGAAPRVLAASLLLATAATTWQGIAALESYHRGASSAMADLAAAAPAAVPGDEGKPVVLSTSVALGSLFDAYPRYRMLRASDEARLAELGRRLIAVGVNRIIVAGYDVTADEASLAGSYHPVESIPAHPNPSLWATAVLVADAS